MRLFKGAGPQTGVTVHEDGTAAIIEAIHSGDLDYGIVASGAFHRWKAIWNGGSYL